MHKRNPEPKKSTGKGLLGAGLVLSVALFAAVAANGGQTRSGILIIFGIFLLPVLVFFPIIFRNIRLATRRRQLRQTIIAQYDLPAKLSAPEIGFMYDSKFSLQEIGACFLSLKQRGFIAPDQTANPDAPNIADLTDFEQVLLTALKHTPISKELLLSVQADFKTKVYESLVQKGYTYGNLQQGYRKRVATMVLWEVISAIVFQGLFVLLAVLGGDHQIATLSFAGDMAIVILFFLPFFILLSYLMTHIYTRIVGLRWVGTDALRALWPDIEGYRIYIQETTLQQLKFESETEQRISSDNALPYAVALGLDKKWRSSLNI